MLQHPPRTARVYRSGGFTLLELSIALVIIGLIIGGVLVGRDLIRAAQLNSTVAQLQGYQTGINNFRARYRGIPGDLIDATSQFSSTKWPNLANGDGNGIIGPGNVDTTATRFDGEFSQFWYQLTAAGMTDEHFDGRSDFPYADGYSGGSIPVSKLGRGTIGTLGRSGDGNYFVLGLTLRVLATDQAVMVMNDVITPEEAYKLDQKMDDGHPLQGKVRASGRAASIWWGPYYYNTAGLAPSMSSEFAIAMRMLGDWIVPSAYAADPALREADTRSEACVFMDEDIGTESAHYATGVNAINCALLMRMQ